MAKNSEQINEACNQLLFAAGETARLDTLYRSLKQESSIVDSQNILAQQAIETAGDIMNTSRWDIPEIMVAAASIQEQYGDALAQSIVLGGFTARVQSRLASAQAEQEKIMKALRWERLDMTFHNSTRATDLWSRNRERKFIFDPGTTITIQPSGVIHHRRIDIEYGLTATYKPALQRFAARAELALPLVSRDGLPLVKLEAVV